MTVSKASSESLILDKPAIAPERTTSFQPALSLRTVCNSFTTLEGSRSVLKAAANSPVSLAAVASTL